MRSNSWRTRWASLGAFAVVAVGFGGVLTSDAAVDESSFVAVTPTRVLDTRTGLGLTGKFNNDVARLLTVTGSIPTADGTAIVVPTGASAVVMNVTVVLPSAGGFVSVRPGDAVGVPTTSNLNFSAGQIIPNAVTVALPAAGNLNLYYFGGIGAQTDLLIDIVGYYTAVPSGPPGVDGLDGVDGPRAPSFGREAVFSSDTYSSGSVGFNPSIGIGVDGLPIIAHTLVGADDLLVTHCNDLACSTATTTAVATTNDVGFEPSLAVGADGFAIIAHRDATASDSELVVTHCTNVACTAATSFTVDPNNDVGHNPAIAIGSDGLPIIAYTEATNTILKVTKCLVLDCTSVTTTPVDEDNSVGHNPAITIGTDGLAIIAHSDLTSNHLRVTHCTNTACTADTTVSVDTSSGVGGSPTIAIGTDGLAIIAHVNSTLGLRISRCNNVVCSTAANSTLPDTTGVAVEPSMTIGLDGFAVIAHRAPIINDLWVTRCSDTGCTTAISAAVDDPIDSVGHAPSIAIGSDGHLVIAHQFAGDENLRVTKVFHRSWTPNGWES